MEVLLNNYKVEFDFGNEKKLSDVIGYLGKWSSDRELVFSNFYIGGEIHAVDQVPDRNIDDIESINCIIQSKSDIVFSTIYEGISYCERIVSYVSNVEREESVIDKESVENIASGLEWMSEVLLYIFRMLNIEIESVKFKDSNVMTSLEKLVSVKKLITSTDKEILPSHFDSISSVLNDVKDIFKIVLISDELKRLVINNIDSPDFLVESLKTVKETLPAQLDNLEQAAVAFQTGKDSEASERLGKFVDFMYGYIRTSYQAVPVFGIDLDSVKIEGRSIEEANMELNELLNEILSAMENRDIITLADVLEYQIKPALENFSAYIDAIYEIILKQ